MDCWMCCDRFVAECDVEGVRLARMRRIKGSELSPARIAFAAAPDRVHVGGDRDQLGDVAVEIAVVVRGIQQALAVRPTVEIVENREAREVRSSNCG
jgi:hypothetical protein